MATNQISAVDHIDIVESPDADVPPRGVTRILRVGGTLYQRVDGAAKTALGGGGGAGPSELATAAARSLALHGSEFSGGGIMEDFIQSATSDGTATAGGTNTVSQTLGGGVYVMTTGASGGSVCRNFTKGTPALIAAMNANPVFLRARVRFNGPTGTDANLIFGLTNQSFNAFAAIGATGTFFGGSNTKFAVNEFYSGASHLTATTVDLETSLYHYVDFYSNGTAGQFYLDGVSVGPAIVMANFGAVPGMWYGQAHTNDATARTVSIDWVYPRYNNQ